MKMEIGVWRSLPDEIALNIIARLLPRRSLVTLRTVWKAWNEMLSSYAAMQRIYPNINLSYTSAFLFQFRRSQIGKIHSWLLEGSGDFYKVGEYSYIIELACNSMFCLHHAQYFYICDENSRSLKRVPYNHVLQFETVRAIHSSADNFIVLAGYRPYRFISVWDSSTGWWRPRSVFSEDSENIKILGQGVYYRGRFYWLDHASCNGGVVELNLPDRLWTKIPPPHDAIYRHSDEVVLGGVPRIASVYWDLAGTDVGQLILVDREYGFMWKLDNSEENIIAKRWSRVDICLPREIKLISVNNIGWTVVVGREGINIYDESRRLVRKLAMDEIDPQLGMGIMKLKDSNSDSISLYPPLLPYECTYVWWPGNIDFRPK